MTIGARLAVAVMCAVTLSCEGSAPPPATPAGEGAPGAGADARPSETVPPAGAQRPGRRGDRRARAAARAGARALHAVTGTVIRAEGGRVAIRPRDDGREVTLKIGPRTTVTARRGAPPRALAPGDEVRASWRGGDDPPTALSVEIQERAAPVTPRR